MVEELYGWAKRMFWPRESFLSFSNGVTSKNKPVKLNGDGLIDQSMLSGTDLAEYISDTVGTMVTGNTETDIAVTYQDADNTLDFVVSSTLVGDRIHNATSKATPVDADELGLADSAASFVLKKLTWANLKATFIATAHSWSAVQTFGSGISLGNETVTVYDTDTYSPAITGSSSNPTVTYTTQTGRYVRFGNKVDYNFVIVINTISGGSGDARFSVPLADGTTSGAVAPITFAGVDIPGTPINVVFRTVGGQAYGRIISNNDNAAQQVVQVSDLAASDTFVVQGAYFL